ncbi:MAG: c-type cytochrome, partial [Planctomycetaceae bacterium]
ALRLADRWLTTNEPLLAKAAAMTDDPDPRVRLQLAMTLGESSDPTAIHGLHTLAVQSGQERWMAAAILSSARESAGPLLVALLRHDKLPSGPRNLLTPLAATLGGQRDAQRIDQILPRLEGHKPEIQSACLSGLVAGLARGNQPLPKSPNGWTSLKPLLSSETPAVQTLAITLAAKLKVADSPELRAAFRRAARAATDDKRPLKERQRSIQLLANAPFETVASAARLLLDVSQPPALQHAFIASLGSSDDQRVAQTLLGQWTSFSPATRKVVLKTVLARENRIPSLLDALKNHSVHRGDLSALQRAQLAANRNPELAKRARQLLTHSTADAELQQRIKRYQDALPGQRSAERGKQVFAKSCLACHQLKQEGFPVGPPLGSVTNKPDAALIQDMLDPSGHIESDYGTYIVVTTQGRTFTGVLASESATSITLRKEKGATDVILRHNVETIKASNVSLMPADLYKQINPQQAIDLIAFLRQAFAKPSKTDERK